MSSLVVDTNMLARQALGDLEKAEDIGPAVERLRTGAEAIGVGTPPEAPSLAMRMVIS